MMNNVSVSIKQHETNKSILVGMEISCPVCNIMFKKKRKDHSFCSNGKIEGKGNCKNEYWNIVGEKKSTQKLSGNKKGNKLPILKVLKKLPLIFLPKNDKEFEVVFYEYHRPLIFYAYNFVDDLVIAEDIVTEVFISLWNKNKKMDLQYIKAFLFLAVKNRCLSYIKVNKRKRIFIKAYTYYEPDNAIITDKVLDLLKDKVKELPSECKKVVDLYLIGLPTDKISEQLNISQKTVHSQKNRAIGLLRKLIKFSDFNDEDSK